jgi:pyruvate dehydrogenase E2 component (dihydrolipoamide acetyltransferase)
MERTVTMPKLGMTMEEGTVLNWRYHEGDWVEKDEPLVEVMTDKVNIEVEAPFTGRLVHILAKEGDALPVGAPIATVNDNKGETSSTTTPVITLAQNEGAQIPAHAAEEHRKGTPLHIPIASTPAAKHEAALYGVDLQAVVQAGAMLPLNRDDVRAFAAVRATPVAQKIAREQQIDLATVAERKPGAKVTRADVEAHLAERAQSPEQSAPLSVSEQETATSELIPLTPVRRLIGQRMVQSITTAPHIYLDTEIDMTEAQRGRQHVGRHLQDKAEQAPSITALLIRAAAAALLRHPEVNATLAPGALQGKDAIRRWQAVHIGIAVDTEQALLTPVIRNAHQQSLLELAQALKRLTLAARQGKLKPDELAGATFTISNLGMYGIDTFHAIIAPGQSAILAVGKVTKRAVVIEDAGTERIEIRPIMKVSLSADHRVLDGASGSRFLHQLKTLLENPYLLL